MRNDRLELINLRGNEAYQPALENMREIYAQALAHWKAHAVAYHDYQRFGEIFDPAIPWKSTPRKSRAKGNGE